MKKIKAFVFSVLVAVLMSGCSVFESASMNDVMSIESGMSKQEVIGRLGKPSLRLFGDGYEELGFNLGYVESTYYYTIIHVRFENNRVVSMETALMPVPSIIESMEK